MREIMNNIFHFVQKKVERNAFTHHQGKRNLRIVSILNNFVPCGTLCFALSKTLFALLYPGSA